MKRATLLSYLFCVVTILSLPVQENLNDLDVRGPVVLKSNEVALAQMNSGSELTTEKKSSVVVDDDLDIPQELQEKMSKNGYEPTNLQEVVSKMNENDPTAAISETEERKIAAELLNAANDRMNTEERLNGNEMNGAVIVTDFSSYNSFNQQTHVQISTQDKTMNNNPESESHFEDNEYVDDDGSESTMNNNDDINETVNRKKDKNHQITNSFDSMNAVSENHDAAMSLMNTMKTKPAEMPSITHAIMPPEPANEAMKNENVPVMSSDFEEQENSLSISEMESLNNSDHEMPQNPEKPAFMPSKTKAKMSEGDSSVIPAIVPESTGEIMQNEVVSVIPVHNEEKKQQTIAKKNVVVENDINKTATKRILNEEVAMNQIMNGGQNENDGNEMGNISNNSHQFTPSTPQVGGFMDEATPEEKNFESQMNTINQKSLDMMSTVS